MRISLKHIIKNKIIVLKRSEILKMSSFFRSEIFDWLIGSVALSNNILTNLVITFILGTLLYVVTFNMVGKLYNTDIISGSIAGKVCYFVLFIINVFITALILRLIQFIIRLYNYVSAFPLWVGLSIVGTIFFIGLLTFYIKSKINNISQ